MALQFDLSGNFIGGPDRMRAGRVVRAVAASEAAVTRSEYEALLRRVEQLETALSQSQSHAVSVSRSQKNKPAPTIDAAKPKDEPWKEVGVSKATWYRRQKPAGTL